MEPFQVLVEFFSRTACCFQSRSTYFALRRITLLVPPEVFRTPSFYIHRSQPLLDRKLAMYIVKNTRYSQ